MRFRLVETITEGDRGQTSLKRVLVSLAHFIYKDFNKNQNYDIHHINGLHDDNRLSNIALMTHGAHSSYHRNKKLGKSLSDYSKHIIPIGKDIENIVWRQGFDEEPLVEMLNSLYSFGITSLKKKVNEGDTSQETFYRLELVDAFGENRGGIFNAVWDLIYSIQDEDEEDDDAYRLEDLVDELMDSHQTPSTWIDGKFAFTKEFFDKNKYIIDEIAKILESFDYELVIKEVQPENIVYRDRDQIAYKDNK